MRRPEKVHWLWTWKGNASGSKRYCSLVVSQAALTAEAKCWFILITVYELSQTSSCPSLCRKGTIVGVSKFGNHVMPPVALGQPEAGEGAQAVQAGTSAARTGVQEWHPLPCTEPLAPDLLEYPGTTQRQED